MANVTILPPPEEQDPIFQEEPRPYTPHLGRMPSKSKMLSIGQVIDRLVKRAGRKPSKREASDG